MLTINQEKALRALKANPSMLASDLPLLQELASLCLRMRELHKSPNTKEAIVERGALYARMDSILQLLGRKPHPILDP